METPETWPSLSEPRSLASSVGGICKRGLAGFAISHVKMSPEEWPPATLDWSADTAIEVIDPHSRASGFILALIALGIYYYAPLVPGPMIVLRLW